MTTTSDNFNRAENPLASGFTAQNGTGFGVLKANGTSVTSTSNSSAGAIYTSIVFSNTYQFSECVGDAVATGDGGPIVFGRSNSTQMYLYDLQGGSANQDGVYKYNGTFNLLGAQFGAGLQTGHTYRIEVTSAAGTSTILTYDNGVTTSIRIDSTAIFSSGAPGLYLSGSTDSMTSWNGGDAVSAGGRQITIFAYGDLSGIGSGGAFFKDRLQ